MQILFDKILALLLAPGREGGFVNDPHDPGGMTNLGVTKREWELFVGHPVDEGDMRSLTPAKVGPFYRRRFWDAVKGDQLPAGFDHVLFDAAVKDGPGHSIRLLQAALGLEEDGQMGPVTLAHVSEAAAKDAATAFARLSAEHLAYLQGKPGWARYGNGWARRIHEVEAEALALAQENGNLPVS